MPEVSIVIAAYRPQYLDVAIASALAQTFRDFELLISDDSDGDEVEAVVAKWTDARIRYTRNPRRQVPKANRDHLLGLASGRYLKFLWDDDFLLPQSVEVLVGVAKAHRAQLAFHHRYFVNANGRPEPSFTPIPAGEVMAVEPGQMFKWLVTDNPKFVNVVGEPTNLLVDATWLRSMPAPFDLGGRRVSFLDDIALFLNLAADRRRVVGVGAALSAFRHHDAQMSNAHSTVSSSGMYEWELVNRWAADTGHVRPEECMTMLQRLREVYATRVREFPELAAFMALDVHPGRDGSFLTAEMDAALTAASRVIDLRRGGRLSGGSINSMLRLEPSVPQPAPPGSSPARSTDAPAPPIAVPRMPAPPGPAVRPIAPMDSGVPPRPRLTLALPVQNQALALARCLVALSRSLPASLDFEVVVVDRGSADGLAEVLAAVSGDLRAEHFDRAVALGTALDQALGASMGDYVCLLDVEKAPQGERVQPLLEALATVPALAAALPLGPDHETPSTDLVVVRSSAVTAIGGFSTCGAPMVEGIVAALKAASLPVAAVGTAPASSTTAPSIGSFDQGQPTVGLAGSPVVAGSLA